MSGNNRVFQLKGGASDRYGIDWGDDLAARNDGAGDTIASGAWESDPAGLSLTLPLVVASDKTEVAARQSTILVAPTVAQIGTTFTIWNTLTLVTDTDVRPPDFISIKVIGVTP